jgi:hypothetical protein
MGKEVLKKSTKNVLLEKTNYEEYVFPANFD